MAARRLPAFLRARSFAGLLLASSLVVGCVSLTGGSGWREELRGALQARGLEPESVLVPFVIGDEARSWVRAQVPEQGGDGERLNRLLERITAPDGLALTYENRFTGTADQVFASHSANCLGFVNLFVGLARELGLPAYFVAVEDKPIFDKEGDLVLVADHVAAGHGYGTEMRLLDFVVGPPRDYQAVRPISDLEALARFHSNRGAELLREGKAREALRWAAQAVRISPEMPSGWVNLGVARRRTADLDGAEQAYRRALELDPKTISAYQNLAALLKLRGHEDEALKLLALTDRGANRNPFSFIALGDWNLEAGRVEEARRLYRRALALDTVTAEPYAALGQLELAAGGRTKARKWLARAEKIDPTNERTRLLARQLAGASS